MNEFERIYQDYGGYVRRTLFWLVRSDARTGTVDDLVQEVFVKIWKGLSKFDAKSSLKTWIYRITVNTAYDHMRSQKNADAITFDSPPHEGTIEHDLFVKDLIRRGIEILHPKQKVVFVLHYKEALSVEEIAESLSLPGGTVKSRLFHAREQFTAFLKKNGVSYE